MRTPWVARSINCPNLYAVSISIAVRLKFQAILHLCFRSQGNSFHHSVPGARIPDTVGPGSYDLEHSLGNLSAKAQWRGAEKGMHLFGSGNRIDIIRVSMMVVLQN